MLRKIAKFIFSPPPAPVDAMPEKSAPRILDPKPAEKPLRDEHGVRGKIILGFGAFCVGTIATFIVAAPAMWIAGPFFTSEMTDAEHVLRPSQTAFIFTAIPIAIAAGLVCAWLFVTRSGQLEARRPSTPMIGLIIAVVAISVAPFFLVLKSRVEFAPDKIRISPVFGFGTTSYPYEDVAAIRASLIGPAGGWIPGPDQFIFAVDFNDGQSWNSTWYPYEADPIQDSILIRYLAKKSGKPATPVPYL